MSLHDLKLYEKMLYVEEERCSLNIVFQASYGSLELLALKVVYPESVMCLAPGLQIWLTFSLDKL